MILENPRRDRLGFEVFLHRARGFSKAAQGRFDWSLPRSHRGGPNRTIDVFLAFLQSGERESFGRMNAPSTFHANAFLKGARDHFPSESPAFLVKAARSWGRLQGKEGPKASPETTAESEAMGRACGERLKKSFELGVAGGLSRALLENFLHRRNVEHYLEIQGWIIGMVESLREDGQDDVATLLEANQSSIVTRALNRGEPSYPKTVIDGLPALLKNFDETVLRFRYDRPEAAQILGANRGSIFSRMLRLGDMTYVRWLSESLPGLLDEMKGAVATLKAEGSPAADYLEINRATIIGCALDSGDFGYVRKATQALPGLVLSLEENILSLKRKNPAAAASLGANRGSVINHALHSGDLGYVEKAAKALPSLIKKVEDSAVSNPGTVIARALHAGALDSVPQ